MRVIPTYQLSDPKDLWEQAFQLGIILKDEGFLEFYLDRKLERINAVIRNRAEYTVVLIGKKVEYLIELDRVRCNHLSKAISLYFEVLQDSDMKLYFRQEWQQTLERLSHLREELCKAPLTTWASEPG